MKLEVETARDLGPQFTENPHRMVGQDGAYSIPLRAGRSLWYFGDTLIGTRPERSLYSIFREIKDGKVEIGHGPFDEMITNTGLLLPPQAGTDGLLGFEYLVRPDGGLRKLVPSLPGEVPERERVWCMHGIELEQRIYLGYMLVLMHETLASPDDIGFEVLGSGLAVGNASTWEFNRLGGGIAHESHADTIWWDVTQPQFGAAMLHEAETGFVYFYGSLQNESTPVQEAHLARVAADAVEQLEQFEYFDGNGWSSEIRKSVPLFGGQPNEMSISHNGYLNQFLAVHSMSLTGDIVGRIAQHPWGPWSDPVVLWTVPDSERVTPDGEPPRAFYAGKEHPILSAEGGRVLYLTYVDNFEYFPHLIEVTLR